MISCPLVLNAIGMTDSHPMGGLHLQGRKKSVMNKDIRFTDMASQYDRVEASIGKTLYSVHPQCQWISEASFWIR